MLASARTQTLTRKNPDNQNELLTFQGKLNQISYFNDTASLKPYETSLDANKNTDNMFYWSKLR